MATRVFHLGPLGRLRELPAPERGIEMTPERLGGVHVALSGRSTLDTLGYRRTYTITWEWLDAEALAVLEVLHFDMTARPLRLVDPGRRNRLTAATSATGSMRAEDHTLVSLGNASVLSEVAGWPPAAAVQASRSVAFTAPAGGDAIAPAWDEVPAVPGEAVTFSAWVLADAPAQVRAQLRGHTDAATSSVLASSAAAVSGTWQRLTVTATTPVVDVAAIRPALTVDAGAGGAVVRTAAWQIEAAEVASEWVPGTGCPPVAVSELPTDADVIGRSDVSMTLVEV